jgi:hypothetical protein
MRSEPGRECALPAKKRLDHLLGGRQFRDRKEFVDRYGVG